MSTSSLELESSCSPVSSSSSSCHYNSDTDTDVDVHCFNSVEDDDWDDAEVIIRHATDDDLDAICSIGIESFPSDPQWNYRYPYREQYPDDHLYFARKRYAEWMVASHSQDCMIMVAVGGHQSSIRNTSCKKGVLAFSIWRLPSPFSDSNNDETCKMKPPVDRLRRDANYSHMKAYRESSLEAEKCYFDPRFGQRRMDLAQLVTDSDYRRRGLATRLVRYGQVMAMTNGWAIGVFASPMGEQLYKKLGFEVLGNVVTQAEDDDEILEFPAMAWSPARCCNSLIKCDEHEEGMASACTNILDF